MPIPGCDCDECQERWFSDLVRYARQLETAARTAKRKLDSGDEEGARTIVEAAAIIARDRNLIGEMKSWRADEDQRRAAHERQAGRLH